MDLFQPVTLAFKDGQARASISFASLRLAVLAVMKDLSPQDRQDVFIVGGQGKLEFLDIVQVYQSLHPTSTRMVSNY